MRCGSLVESQSSDGGAENARVENPGVENIAP